MAFQLFQIFCCRDQHLQNIIKFQSQRKMSLEDIANYLIEVGSNERKLQYCRQILTENSLFTPQAAFNLNSTQIKTTLFKNQLLELFRSTGLTSAQEELQLIFSYFQIDGKNYVTLQQFSSILLLESDHPQQNSKKYENSQGKYSLKYSLQKLFSQILDNQTNLERLYKSKLDGLKENAKITYNKVTNDQLKSFLAYHGKFPNQKILKQILKELSVNKGTSKRHKLIVQKILQFTHKTSNNLSTTKNTSVQLKDIKAQIKSQVFSNQTTILKEYNDSNYSKLCLMIQNTKASQSFIKNCEEKSNIESQNSNFGSVQEKIKSLMNSIIIKNRSNQQSKCSITKNASQFTAQIDSKQHTKDQQFKHQRQFREIKCFQNYQVKRTFDDDLKSKRSYKIDDYSISQRMDKYKKNKVLSQENNDSISFNSASRDRFFSKNSRPLATEHSKQNEIITADKSKHKKQNRLSYLKSLVGQGSENKSKHAQTFRF